VLFRSRRRPLMRTRGRVLKGPKEVVMADNRDPLEKERDVLVTCVEEAYEALRLLPGLDANGPAVV